MQVGKLESRNSAALLTALHRKPAAAEILIELKLQSYSRKGDCCRPTNASLSVETSDATLSVSCGQTEDMLQREQAAEFLCITGLPLLRGNYDCYPTVALISEVTGGGSHGLHFCKHIPLRTDLSFETTLVMNAGVAKSEFDFYPILPAEK